MSKKWNIYWHFVEKELEKMIQEEYLGARPPVTIFMKMKDEAEDKMQCYAPVIQILNTNDDAAEALFWIREPDEDWQADLEEFGVNLGGNDECICSRDGRDCCGTWLSSPVTEPFTVPGTVGVFVRQEFWQCV